MEIRSSYNAGRPDTRGGRFRFRCTWPEFPHQSRPGDLVRRFSIHHQTGFGPSANQLNGNNGIIHRWTPPTTGARLKAAIIQSAP